MHWALLFLCYSFVLINVSEAGSGPDPAFLSRVCRKDSKQFLFGEVDWGLNNQRWEILLHLAAAKRFKLAYVPPRLMMDTLKECPGSPTRQPFDRLYSIDVILRFAAQHNITVAQEVPDEIKRLCCRSWTEEAPPLMEQLSQPIEGRGICMPHAQSFYEMPLIFGCDKGDTEMAQFFLSSPEVAEMRPALSPSPLIAEQVTYVTQSLIQLYGTCQAANVGGRKLFNPVPQEAMLNPDCMPEFGVVHLRIEEEFVKSCGVHAQRNQMKCTYSGDEVEALLPKHGLQPGSLIMIISGHPLDSMGKLCKNYKCFKATDIWAQGPGFGGFGCVSRIFNASVSFWAAMRGSSFFGHIHSSFSVELAASFMASGKKAEFYNEPCDTKAGIPCI